MPATILIDGSQGEGGGQILRTSLALAALLRQPVKIDNIRANRSQPGLKTQHLAGVKALAEITAAAVNGAYKHSTSLYFAPRLIKGGRYHFEISTAGATSLLLSAVLPALLAAARPTEVTITGGTHVPFSPPFHYMDRVFLPTLRRLGCSVDLELEHWGFYPKGGGEIRVCIKPCTILQGVHFIHRGSLQSLKLSACSTVHLPAHIGRREVDQVETSLAGYSDRIDPEIVACNSLSPGNFIFLEADYENGAAGFSALGRRGKPAEEVAETVCRAFRVFDVSEATMDRYLADQIILYMALAQGTSSFVTEKTSRHLMTNIDIISKFLPARIKVNDTSGRVDIAGTGAI